MIKRLWKYLQLRMRLFHIYMSAKIVTKTDLAHFDECIFVLGVEFG